VERLLNNSSEKTVEIFKTNITTVWEANLVLKNLRMHFPSCRINFDLEDCDRILRIEGKACEIEIDIILQVVRDLCFEIDLIEDEAF